MDNRLEEKEFRFVLEGIIQGRDQAHALGKLACAVAGTMFVHEIKCKGEEK